MSTRKGLLIAAYGLLILVGLALAYLALRGTFPAIVGVLLSFAYIAVILVLVRYQMRALPPSEQHHFAFRISIRFQYLIKSLLCLVIAFAWTAVIASITGDSRIGVTLAVGPALVIVGAGTYFFVRSFPNPFQ